MYIHVILNPVHFLLQVFIIADSDSTGKINLIYIYIYIYTYMYMYYIYRYVCMYIYIYLLYLYLFIMYINVILSPSHFLSQVFIMADSDGTGKINLEELKNLHHVLGARFPPLCLNMSYPQLFLTQLIRGLRSLKS